MYATLYDYVFKGVKTWFITLYFNGYKGQDVIHHSNLTIYK